jgi:hypothetical protein
MPFHTPKSLTPMAERLAGLLNSEQGTHILRLMARLSSEQMHAAKPSSPAAPPPRVPQVTAGRIGIWQLTQSDGVQTYDRVGDNVWNLWADQRQLHPKSERRRVVLVGESAARGFLYDPGFNPARALRAMLGTVKETSDVEVIDLARVDCGGQTLVNVAASCMALEPDALVVLAGNNWAPFGNLDAVAFHEIAGRLRAKRRWSEVKDYAEEQVRLAAVSVLEAIAKIARERSLPVILILPEFNLRDWQTECIEAINFLPWTVAGRWREMYREAKAALRDKDMEKAAALAGEMMALDEGATSASQEILAYCKAAAGEMSEARRLLEGARDTALCTPGIDSPRCFSVIQEVFRSRASELGMRLVDLPRRFEEYLCGEIPDRRLFLDYCHFTLDGMRVAMASVAEQLLPIFDAPPQSWRQFAGVELTVPGEVCAAAHLLAAIHNSHWRQGYEIIHYHCRRAIESDAKFARTMTQFLDHYIRRAPAMLCQSFHDIVWDEDKPLWGTYLRMGGEPQQAKILNPFLVEAITDVLKPVAPEVQQQTLSLLIEQHGIERRDADLLDPVYWGISYTQREQDWTRGFGYYVSFTPESVFRIPCRQGQPFTLTLTYRASPRAAEAEKGVRVSVNDRQVATLEAVPSWRTVTVRVPSEYVRSGLNAVGIDWPQVSYSGTDEIQRIVEQLELGFIPSLFPIYGELHAAVASTREALAD